jgi:hypothetical protein
VTALNTTGYRLKNSRKFPDELITRVPVDYLKWMVNIRHTESDYAQAELDRRGTVTPDLDISGHAIDRASLRCRHIWHETALNEDEGLHAWLVRMSMAALKEGERRDDKVFYRGLKFVFAMDGVWPVLKSVMPKKNKGGQDGKET